MLRDGARRTTLTIPDNMVREIDRLKQKDFYNDSKANLLRYLLQLGLEKAAQDEEANAAQ